jgi:hypothetical protein
MSSESRLLDQVYPLVLTAVHKHVAVPAKLKLRYPLSPYFRHMVALKPFQTQRQQIRQYTFYVSNIGSIICVEHRSTQLACSAANHGMRSL